MFFTLTKFGKEATLKKENFTPGIFTQSNFAKVAMLYMPT